MCTYTRPLMQLSVLLYGERAKNVFAVMRNQFEKGD